MTVELMLSQGTITGDVLTATGDVSDPLQTLVAGTGLYPGSTFSGSLPPDATHPGRYSPFSLAATINGTKGAFTVVTENSCFGLRLTPTAYGWDLCNSRVRWLVCHS